MTFKLTDKQLEKILSVLKKFLEIRLGLPRQSRRFIARRPLNEPFEVKQWRLLPKENDNWNTA